MARKVSPGRTGDDGADATLVGDREIETTDAEAVEAAGHAVPDLAPDLQPGPDAVVSEPVEVPISWDPASTGVAPEGPVSDRMTSDGSDALLQGDVPLDLVAVDVPSANDGPPDLSPREPGPEDAPALVLPSDDVGRPEPRRDAGPESTPGAKPDPWREAVPAASLAAVPPPRRGGAGALVLGGAVAAALGFGAAWAVRDGVVPGLGPDATLQDPAIPDLAARVAALEEAPTSTDSPDLVARLDAVEARLATVEASSAAAPSTDDGAGPDLAALRADLDAAAGAAEAAQAEARGLTDRIAALEAAPAAAPANDAPPPAAAAATVDVAALRDGVAAELEPRLSTLEEGLADLEGRLTAAETAAAAAQEAATAAAADLSTATATAEAAAARAAGDAALARLRAALEAGEPLPLADATPALDAAGATLPEPLAALGEAGAPTLVALQDAFPEAARAALAAARAGEEGGGLGGALGRWFSIRSTAPRAGDDPDAILSRAGAAVDQGRLAAALGELDVLPEASRAAIEGWLADARVRVAAESALATLADALAATPAPAPTDAAAD